MKKSAAAEKKPGAAADQRDWTWLDAGKGYALALVGRKIHCRNAKGVLLASLPASLKESELAEELRALAAWLGEHFAECRATLELAMLRSLPLPRVLIEKVWLDPYWRRMLENAVLVPVNAAGVWQVAEAGFLRGAEPGRLGIVDTDGETRWLDAEQVALPHPILLPELQDLRELATELGLQQALPQLFRETWARGTERPSAATRVEDYAEGHFDQLLHVMGRARSLGYRVRGGWASCVVFEAGLLVEARYWLGDDYPEAEAWTGELSWVDEAGRTLRLAELGPVAYSEGHRMASLIYAGRVIDDDLAGDLAFEPGSEESTLSFAASLPRERALPSSTATAAEILAAGGVVPEEALLPEEVPSDLLEARLYRHRALGEVAISRLVPALLAPSEDIVMDFLHFGPAESQGYVGRQRRRVLGFPGWPLVHDKEHAAFALEVMKEFKQIARRAGAKPGFAKAGFDAIGKRLGSSVPYFLPSFYEEVGRVFIEVANAPFAGTFFNKAREAERVHNLAVDEAERLQSFVEFALAGALNIKALTAYAQELGKSYTPGEAYGHFLDLCLRRCLSGLSPYAGMAKDLRALAKKAGLSAKLEDEKLLRALFAGSALSRAPAEFWSVYHTALVGLARSDAEIRGKLLALMPHEDLDREAQGRYLDLLRESGAFAGWCDENGLETETLATEEPGAAAAFLSQWIAYGGLSLPEQIFPLVRDLAPRLRTEGVPIVPAGKGIGIDMDLLELALELGIPVAPSGLRLGFTAWLKSVPSEYRQRDPRHIAADKRFAQELDDLVHAAMSNEAFAGVARGKNSLVPARGKYFDLWLDAACAGTVPSLRDAFDAVNRALSPEALAEFPHLWGRLQSIDPALSLARTLRGGLLDELGWPAFDAAVAELQGMLKFAGIYPYLAVTDDKKVLVVGAKGRLYEHGLRLPAGARLVLLRYVDGQLLVVFRDSNYENRAYWSGSPSDIFAVSYYDRNDMLSPCLAFELAAGGLSEGGKALRAGARAYSNTSFEIFFDGATSWRSVRSGSGQRLQEYAPGSGDSGRFSWPTFFETFLEEDWQLEVGACSLGLLPPGLSSSPLGAQDGLIGFRVRCRAAQLELEAEAVDGRSWRGFVGRRGKPIGLIDFPGDERRRPITRGPHGPSLWDVEGRFELAVTAPSGRSEHARGTASILPASFWHFLAPRDQAGSRALRRCSDEVARQLLACAAAEFLAESSTYEQTSALVGQLLPEIESPLLLQGVVGMVRSAALQQARFERRLAALESLRIPAEPAREIDLGIDESCLAGALVEFFDTSHFRRVKTDQCALQAQQTWQFFEALAQGKKSDRSAKVAIAYPHWEILLGQLGSLAFLVAQGWLKDEQRKALQLFLALLANFGDELGRLRTFVCADSLERDAGAPSQWLCVEGGNGYLIKASTDGKGALYRKILWVLEYAPEGKFRALRGTVVESSVLCSGGLSGRAKIEAFLSMLEQSFERRSEPEAVAELARRTGLFPAAAALIWHPSPDLDQPGPLADHLGLKADEVALALAQLRQWLPQNRLPDWLLRAYDFAMQGDPQTRWRPLGGGLQDENSVVARLARALKAQWGTLPAIPAELALDACREFHGCQFDVLKGLAAFADPGLAPAFHREADWRIQLSSGRIELKPTTDLEDVFQRSALAATAHLLPWLYQRLPVGDPLRQGLPKLLELARARLASPGLLIPLTNLSFEPDQALAAFEAFGGEPYSHPQVAAQETPQGSDAGDLVAIFQGMPYWQILLYLRPAKVRDFVALTHLASQGGKAELGRVVSQLEWVLSPASQAMAERVRKTPVPAGQWEHNPLYAVPELVAQVAAHLGLDEDGAVLYLQTLALAEPTAKAIKLWNGWTTPRYQRAAAALVAAGLLLEGKRERAGRAHFLPGGWTPQKSPNLPLESWKLPLYSLPKSGERDRRPFERILPLLPLHELFAVAWSRILDGDIPAYESV